MSSHAIKQFGPGSKGLIERLRRLCLALPDVTEKMAWGAPTWRVGGRLFAQLADHHHGNAHLAVWLAAPDGAQQALIEAEPTRFFRPAYVGHLGWVAAILEEDSDWDMVAMVAMQAHAEVVKKLSRKKQMEIAGAGQAVAVTKKAAPAKAKKLAVKKAASTKKKAAPTKKKAASTKKATPAKAKKPATKKKATRR